MKKALIITYYWPPSAGAGVQRWLKFVKYLREFGWEPIVYTPENPEPPDYDETLLSDIPEKLTVIKKSIWEPYSIYKKLTGQKKDARITHGFLKEKNKNSFAEKLSVMIRGNFFIPDARCFWIKPSVKVLTQYLKSNPADVIVSSGPPHSMHLIAKDVKEKLNIPWLADFRDPWTGIDFYEKLMLTGFADRKHKKLEKRVLHSADKIIAVGHHLAKRLEKIAGHKVEVITNGFDEDDFSFLPVKTGDSFTITHIGSLNQARNPELLWQAIAELCSENEDIKQKLRLRFVGKTDFTLQENLSKYGLENHTEIIPYLPHQQALKLAASSTILLLLINQSPNRHGIVTGKIFEYLAAARPILCIGPKDGESAKIIADSSAGMVCDFQDKVLMKKNLALLFSRYGAGGGQTKNIEKFSRKNLTQDLASVLNTMIEK